MSTSWKQNPASNRGKEGIDMPMLCHQHRTPKKIHDKDDTTGVLKAAHPCTVPPPATMTPSIHVLGAGVTCSALATG